MTRLTLAIIAAILFASLFVHTVNAAPTVDPTDGIITELSFDRESGIYTAKLSQLISGRMNTGIYSEPNLVGLKFTEEMTPSVDLVNGHVDLYVETVNDDDGTISQGNRYYRFWTIEITETHHVMLAINGQHGDPIYDNAMVKLGNKCSVLAVIDDSSDPLSSTIYTKVMCNLSQTTIDNLPESLGEALIAILPLYTVNMPVIAQ